MGRPKKENAVKSGELQEGLQRFSFIVDKQVIQELKQLSKNRKLSIKELMGQVLTTYIENEKPKSKNEKLLSEFLKNKGVKKPPVKN